MNEEETDKELSERLHKIFPSPEVARRIIDMATSKRPMGWSHRSNAPYYKEEYAIQIKEYIDKMIESREPIIYRYSVFCSDEGMSTRTLYNRIYQSIRYLIECLDTDDHKYARWYESVDVSRVPGTGVIINFLPEFKNGELSSFVPEIVQPKENKPYWVHEMNEWIEGTTTQPYVVERLALTPEEVRAFKIQFAGVKGIMASVCSSSIKIIRTNE